MSDFVQNQNIKEQIDHLPGDVLLSIATNDATPSRNKRAAVELMLEHEYAQAASPFIAHIVAEVKADLVAKTEVTEIVEQAAEKPLPVKAVEKPKDKPSASKAAVTTQTIAESVKVE